VQDAATGEAVANYLKAVGLKVNLKVIGDQPAYIELMRKREHNAAFIAWSPGTFDPDQVLRRLLWGENAGKPWNFGGFKDDAVDALIERAAREEGRALERREQALQRSLLQHDDAFSRTSLTQAERRWLVANRSPEAKRWNVLATLNVDRLVNAV